MAIDRREFFAGLGTAATAAGATAAAAKHDFLWPRNQTYLNSAGRHPISVASRQAIDRYLDFELHGPGDGRKPVGEQDLHEVKRLYGELINAKPEEIALIQSTQVGENIVADGLGLPEAGGNVVTDALHFHGGIYHWKALEDRGLEVRVVQPRDWRIEMSDLESAVDRNTRLVALTLVSNLNGFQHDARAVSELAHAHNAYFYADVIQAAGCVPLDVRAMGIDFCSAATFKWLMGLHGLGYLYVREDLQERVLGTRRFGDKHYRNFTYGAEEFSWEPRAGAAKYEIGSVSDAAVVCQQASLPYLLDVGVKKIRAHVKPLTDRLLREVPSRGYSAITPPGTPTPIVAFLVDDEEKLRAKLARANVNAKVKWGQFRVSPSVFNTQEDVDRLLEAIS